MSFSMRTNPYVVKADVDADDPETVYVAIATTRREWGTRLSRAEAQKLAYTLLSLSVEL